MQLTEHFKLDEFRCKCCRKADYVDDLQRLAMALEKIRSLVGQPLLITSGWRCKQHNMRVGGAYKSPHLKGLAADIACHTSLFRYKLVAAALECGIKRIGIGPNFVHVDLLDSDGMIWTYY